MSLLQPGHLELTILLADLCFDELELKFFKSFFKKDFLLLENTYGIKKNASRPFTKIDLNTSLWDSNKSSFYQAPFQTDIDHKRARVESELDGESFEIDYELELNSTGRDQYTSYIKRANKEIERLKKVLASVLEQNQTLTENLSDAKVAKKSVSVSYGMMVAGRALGGSSSTATPASSCTTPTTTVTPTPTYSLGTGSVVGFTSSAATTTAGSQALTVLRMLKALVLRD